MLWLYSFQWGQLAVTAAPAAPASTTCTRTCTATIYYYCYCYTAAAAAGATTATATCCSSAVGKLAMHAVFTTGIGTGYLTNFNTKKNC